MLISKLLIGQQSVRNDEQIVGMIEHVKQGGFWSKEILKNFNKDRVALITITEFEDGMLLIHDGHHRILSTYLGSRDYLREDEFEIQKWKYDQYYVVEFENKWVTPYDPRKEVRMADFFEFKNFVLDMAVKMGAAEAERYIWNNRDKFALPRKMFSISDLAIEYNKICSFKIAV